MYRITICEHIYIGSTGDFKQRKIEHKRCFFNAIRKEHKLKLYQTIRENGGWECAEIVPIEEYECETKTQAHIREEHWRREYNAQMNMIRAHRTREEFVQQHRDKATEYYKANVEKIKIYKGEKIQCECGATVSRSNKSNHNKTKNHTDLIAAQQQNITV